MNTSILPALTEAVHAAGAAVLELSRSHLDVQAKEGNDIVTAGDKLSQEIILQHLSRAYPSIPIVAEEQANPQINQTTYFTVDPIDGTALYFQGAKQWGVTACYIQDGQPHSGIIYLPRLNTTITSARGQGTSVNGAPTKLFHNRPLSRTVVGSEVGFFVPRPIMTKYLFPLSEAALGIRSTLSAVGSSLELLEGTTSAYVAMHGGKVWDYAAAALAVEEAGGYVRTLKGETPRWDTLYTELVFAANEQLGTEIIRVFEKEGASFSGKS